MSQQQLTNYMNPEMFRQFLFWLIRLPPFHSDTGRPPMPAQYFVNLAKIRYGCGLRITEGLELTPKDFDLNNKILRVVDPKTAKGGYQKTTILPYDVDWLERFFSEFNRDEKMFNTTRMTVWKYEKDAGIMAGLQIAEEQKQKSIIGSWTHLFRKSCSKRMRMMGAERELRMCKLRHSFKDAHDTYDAVDLNTLKAWELEHMPKESPY